MSLSPGKTRVASAEGRPVDTIVTCTIEGLDADDAHILRWKLRQLPGTRTVTVDIDHRLVVVAGLATQSQVERAMKQLAVVATFANSAPTCRTFRERLSEAFRAFFGSSREGPFVPHDP